MSRRDTALLVIDVQEKLIGHIGDHERVVWNVGRLVQGAHTLGLPSAVSEQYPQGLGPTVPELARQLGPAPAKRTFSCGGCAELNRWLEELATRGVHKLLLCGIEAHVCVQQSAMDLMTEGFDVYVAVDAVGSRRKVDYRFALRRMDSAGATLTTTEAALMEWCETAAAPEFKQISALVRQTAPPASETRA
jgi:nicotinamidase-related amidase